MLITSTKNEIVKSVRRLRERSARRESGQHLIEGERLVFDALEAGIVPETLFIEQGRTDFEARVSALGAEFFSVSRADTRQIESKFSLRSFAFSLSQNPYAFC